MYDDRPLVDLLNSRCDDIISRIEDLKRDVVRGQDKHEADDKDLFKKLDERVTSVERIYWKVSGALVVVLALVKVVERLIFQ